jgi:hypothetical protein
MGLGDDDITGGTGDDTFNVDAGTDTINDLTGDAADGGADDDVLVVSAGATANVTTVGFEATAETSNAGTANITTAADDQTIDMTDASGPNGYVLTGEGSALDQAVLIGSAFADTINGGDSTSAAGDADTLTGNGGADVFEFTIGYSTPSAPTETVVAVAEDAEELTVTGDGDADSGTEQLVIAYSVDGNANAFILDDTTVDGGVDFQDDATVAQAIADAFNTLSGITATITDNTGTHTVDIVAADGGSVEVLSVTVNNASGTLAVAEANDGGMNTEANDTVGAITAHIDREGEAYTPTIGDVYTVTATAAEGQTYIASFTATAATAANVATGLAAAFNAVVDAASGNINANANVEDIEFTDENADDGGFSIEITVAPAVTGSGASDLGATTSSTADIITDFVSGEDTVDLDIAAGSASNYVEAAEAANYATALADAGSAFDGTVQYYLTSLADDPDTGAANDAIGTVLRR